MSVAMKNWSSHASAGTSASAAAYSRRASSSLPWDASVDAW